MALGLALATGFLLTLAAAEADPEPFIVDATPGHGLTFDGIGAVSGGGATSRLLFDYPPKIASDILDYLFKPNFALSLQMLKVEIGSDTDATEGAEPSHMRKQGHTNFHRGYEWWLMTEAKKRNPNIKLYGLPWGWPGWLDPNATADRKSVQAFANMTQTANYTLQWILGAKREHGLDIDYVGQWNENDAPPEYPKVLRRMLKKHHLNTTVLDRMTHYAGSGSIDTTALDAGMQHGNWENGNVPDPHSCDKVQWNATNKGWDDEEGSTYDGVLGNQNGGYQESARCLARVVNRAYLNQCRTATIQWYLIDSFYSFLPWRHCGVGIANQPWSGHYKMRTPLWALAHTTQFSEVGWHYLRHNSGVGKLRKGGSYVTRVSPNGEDWSIVIEKMRPENSSCTRGSNPHHPTYAEVAVFQVRGALAKKTQLYGWWSNFNHNNEFPTEDVFRKRFDIKLAADGTFKVKVGVNEVITVTTLTRGAKGHHHAPVAAPFPKSYSDDFEHTRVRRPPRYWFDQMGAWEVQHEKKRKNKLMRQVVTVWPNCWGYSCSGPKAYFGPTPLVNSKVSMDVMLEDDGKWTLNHMTIGTDGKWSFGKKLRGHGASFQKNVWHHVVYTVTPKYVSGSVDGKQLFLSRTPGVVSFVGRGATSPSHVGQAALKMSLNRYIHANVDNFRIEPVAPEGNQTLRRRPRFLALRPRKTLTQ